MSVGFSFHGGSVAPHRQPAPKWNGKTTAKMERILDFRNVDDPNLLWLAGFHLSKLGIDGRNPVTERLVAAARQRLINNQKDMTSRRIRKINQAHDYLMNLFHHPRGSEMMLAPRARYNLMKESGKIVRFKMEVETRTIPRKTIRPAADISMSYKRLVAKRQRHVLQLEQIRDPVLLEAAWLCLSVLGCQEGEIHKLTRHSIRKARRKLTWSLHPDRDARNMSPGVQRRLEIVHAAHHYILSLFHHQDVIRHITAL